MACTVWDVREIKEANIIYELLSSLSIYSCVSSCIYLTFLACSKIVVYLSVMLVVVSFEGKCCQEQLSFSLVGMWKE